MKHLNLLLAAAFLSVSTILPAQGYLKGKILYFDNGISITERGGSSFDFSLLGGLDTKSSVSLLSVERALEKAAEDPEIAMESHSATHPTISGPLPTGCSCIPVRAAP